MFAPWGPKAPVSHEAGSGMSVPLTWKAHPCKWAYVILSDNMRWARLIELVCMVMRGGMRARRPQCQRRDYSPARSTGSRDTQIAFTKLVRIGSRIMGLKLNVHGMQLLVDVEPVYPLL